jgi:hypothetical protein
MLLTQIPEESKSKSNIRVPVYDERATEDAVIGETVRSTSARGGWRGAAARATVTDSKTATVAEHVSA